MKRNWTPEFIIELNGLSDRIIAYRVLMEKGLVAVPLEFKNLRANVTKMLATHDKLNTNIRKATEKGETAASHASDYGKMYEGIAQDIEFAATQLGNSGESSEVETEKEVITDKDVGDAAPLLDGSDASAESGH